MSRTTLINFHNNQPSNGKEFPNAWGGAARIWDSLFQHYLKDPQIPCHNWMMDQEKLWGLFNDKSLPLFERAVHGFTFDLFYVKRDNFQRFARDLRKFVEDHPRPSGWVDHLPAWADEFESSQADAIGLYATSVGENLWLPWDEEKERHVPVLLSDGFEVYEVLEK